MQSYIDKLMNEFKRGQEIVYDSESGLKVLNNDGSLALYTLENDGTKPQDIKAMQKLCQSNKIPDLYLPDQKTKLTDSEINYVCSQPQMQTKTPQLPAMVSPYTPVERYGAYGKIKDCKERDNGIAGIIALLAGVLGFHHFYLGNYNKGFLYLSMTILGAFLGWLSVFFYFINACIILASLFDAYYFLSSSSPLEFEQFNVDNPRYRCYYRR